MNKNFLTTHAAVLLIAFAIACGDDAGETDAGLDMSADTATDTAEDTATDTAEDTAEDAVEDTGPLPSECSATFTAGGDALELCAIEDTVQHVRIEGVSASGTHASAQIYFGFDEAPGATDPLGADQFKILFYSGGGATPPPPQLQASFGAADSSLTDDASFITEEHTVCFDIHDGAPPTLAFWVDGQGGADCSDLSTLTVDNALALRAEWLDEEGAALEGEINKDAGIYFSQHALIESAPTITLSHETALTREAIEEATATEPSCTTSWVENTDWQALCVPDAGTAQHYRVENIAASNPNSYWYVIVNEESETPADAPSAGDGKLIITGGQAHDTSSWTYFRFNNESTTQFTYDSLYVDAEPSTVCFDVIAGAESTRVVFWGTGHEGADCADWSTLTADNAYFDSATDESVNWDVAAAAGHHFVKTNNANVSIGDVIVFDSSVL